MTSLADFRRPILVAGEVFDGKCQAFRMDGGQGVPLDMRALVQLESSCKCLGYFCRSADNVALVDSIDCKREWDEAANAAAYLTGAQLRAHADALVGFKVSAKTFASMLILCRLAASSGEGNLHREIQRAVRDGKYVLWLVVCNDVSPGDARELDNLRVRLQQWLHGVIRVEILRRNDLRKKYPAD